MPITQQQAMDWTGSATADQLTAPAIQSSHPDGRLTVDTCRKMISVSTAVVYCLVPGGAQPPILPLPRTSVRALAWCETLLNRNKRKEEALVKVGNRSILANRNPANDATFLKTYGHQEYITEGNTNIPYLRVSKSPFC